MTTAESSHPKHSQVFAALRRDIQSGRFKGGERLPSEAALGRTFNASRITVGRAVRDLQAAGLVERRAGSGTFVSVPRVAGRLSFGLLIPDLGDTEIFEPICQGMMASPLARDHALIWGSVPDDGGLVGTSGADKGERAWRLCRQYIERAVSGVFFAPLEFGSSRLPRRSSDDQRSPGDGNVNQRIVDALDAARIPVVLLDRTVVPYPQRGRHDLVGIDNRRAGFVVTEHLWTLGARRIAFVALPHSAATVDAREAGYREALYAQGALPDPGLAFRLDPTATSDVAGLLLPAEPDAIVCANDRTAAQLMRALVALGRRVPEDIRLVGIDDAGVAELLPVPLTTLRQPSRQLGDAAISAMLERVARTDLPPREIFLHCSLMVRQSCGAAMDRKSGPQDL